MESEEQRRERLIKERDRLRYRLRLQRASLEIERLKEKIALLRDQAATDPPRDETPRNDVQPDDDKRDENDPEAGRPAIENCPGSVTLSRKSDDALRAQALDLFGAGRSVREVANELHLSKSAVGRIRRQWDGRGTVVGQGQ